MWTDRLVIEMTMAFEMVRVVVGESSESVVHN
jgi:hypothetical protein